MRRLISAILVAVAMLAFAGRIREASPRLMERMMEDIMPKMMDSCFAQMSPERRAFMLNHCRGMLDRMDEKYVRTEAT